MSRLSVYLAKTKLLDRLFKRPAARLAKPEYAAVYRGPGGEEVRLAVQRFDRSPTIGAPAAFEAELVNAGSQPSPPLHLRLIWEVKTGGSSADMRFEQMPLEFPSLKPGAKKAGASTAQIPVNTPFDVNITFDLISGSEAWRRVSETAPITRHITGLESAHVDADFDYDAIYAAVDLEKDYWSIVGPASREEYETNGRSKRDALLALGLNAHSKVLDIGCGTGQLTEVLVPILGTSGLYYGTDIVEKAVEFCRKRFPLPNFHFVRNGQTDLPVSGIRFDIIYLGSVFTHMAPKEIDAMLAEMRRLMDDTGFVFADAFVSADVEDYTGGQGMAIVNEAKLLESFTSRGFAHRELYHLNWNESCRRVVYHLTAA